MGEVKVAPSRRNEALVRVHKDVHRRLVDVSMRTGAPMGDIIAWLLDQYAASGGPVVDLGATGGEQVVAQAASKGKTKVKKQATGGSQGRMKAAARKKEPYHKRRSRSRRVRAPILERVVDPLEKDFTWRFLNQTGTFGTWVCNRCGMEVGMGVESRREHLRTNHGREV